MDSCAKIFGLEITRYIVGCKGMDKKFVNLIIIMQTVIKKLVFMQRKVDT